MSYCTFFFFTSDRVSTASLTVSRICVTGMLLAVGHDADDIERRLIAIAAARERNLRSGHDQRNRNVELVRLHAEIAVARYSGKSVRRQFRSKLLLQLKFSVLLRRMPVSRRARNSRGGSRSSAPGILTFTVMRR